MSALNESSYDKISEQFLFSREKSQVHQKVIEFANNLDKHCKVLDIGCGGGVPNSKYLTEKGLIVTGIDISKNLLSQALKNVPNATFLMSDITQFHTQDTFSGIIAWDSLFHLEYSEHESVFRKIYNLLKPGGLFLFTHGGTEGEILGEMHGEQFSYSSLGPVKTKTLLEEIGFKIISWEVNQSEENGYLIGLVAKP